LNEGFRKPIKTPKPVKQLKSQEKLRRKSSKDIKSEKRPKQTRFAILDSDNKARK